MAASIPSVTPPPSSTTAATPGLRTATDLDQLWEAIQTAIRSVIQVRHISLLVQPFPGSPPLLYPVDDRGEASEGALRHGELSPVLRYVLHRPTVRLVRLSDFTPV